MPMFPGARLGPYDLQSRLGGGGMGEVWKAYDAKLQRTVAIKVLHDTADAAGRILAEARAASALNHPHICTIHDVGAAAPSTGSGQAVSFIVMEYVDGKPLSEVIPADGLPPGSVIRYGTQIADALAHAHQHEIVHRDIKSANVVITPDGRAKVLDFGVARKLPAAAGGPAARVTADQDQLRIVGWSPDARAIHFVNETGLRAVTVADGRVRSTMSFRGRHGAFVATSGSAVSRDGHFVYFMWREDQGDIWLMDVVRGGR